MCDPPTFERVESKDATVVECAEGGALEVVWTLRLGTFACALPECPAADATVAANAGRYWAVPAVRFPAPSTPLGGQTMGLAVVQLDDAGTLEHAKATDLRRKLDGAFPEFVTRVLHVDADGALHAVLPARDDDGLELRRYGLDGALESTHELVEGALTSYADAAWFADGGLAVVYRHVEGGGTATSGASLRAGIARFAASGELLWNQTLLSRMWDADPTIAVLSTSIAGVDATGAVTLRLAELHEDGTAEGVRLLRLGVDGNVVWAKQLQGDARVPSDSLSAGARVFADGSSTLYYTDESEFASYVERLDASGDSLARLRFPLYGGSGMPIFDSEARLVVANLNDTDPRVLIASVDSPSCTTYTLSVSRCPDEPDCSGSPSVALDPAENLYFGIGDAVGLARLP